MIEANSLPFSGGILVAGVVWAAVSALALGPIVAKRTIENTSWHITCPAELRKASKMQIPDMPSMPNIQCGDIMTIFGSNSDQFCRQGGDAIFNMLKYDPLAKQKQQLRQNKIDRLNRIAELAPTRCSCAASVVAADRWTWGVYSGSARLAGDPQNLKANLTQALHGPVCARLAEVR